MVALREAGKRNAKMTLATDASKKATPQRSERF
jgi:hypothetical protein